MRVLGVDACPGAWVGIAWQGGERLWPYLAGTVADVVAACLDDGPLAVVGVDIPIGLPVDGSRQADRLARKLIGARASSVFSTPVRQALLAADYATACTISVRRSGVGISKQAYGMAKRILEVDAWLRTVPTGGRRPPVYEVHPEVTFAQMARGPLAYAKRSWAGAEQRRMLLAREGLFLAGTLGDAGGRAGVDDVLDAAAVAWSAARVATRDAHPIPEPPELLGGVPAAIWV